MKFKDYRDETLKTFLGDRFTVTYLIMGRDEKNALETGKAMCVEQTVEFPAAAIEADVIHTDIIGRIETFEACPEGFRCVISYNSAGATEEFAQFFNMVFGNSSFIPFVRVEDIQISKDMEKAFPGPKYGLAGMRQLLGIGTDRPLTFTAIKPMGVPVEALAEEAYHCARGGIDLIKDDHGLANHAFSPYKERVFAVSQAVKRGNEETGHHALYIPNVPGCGPEIMERVHMAEDAGAGALMLIPGLVSFDMMKYVSEHTELPVVCHPAMAAAMLDKGSGGFECGLLFGLLPRLCGADLTVFPNYGGRFSLTEDQCRSIVGWCRDPYADLKPIYPCPAGGMTFDRVQNMLDFYGRDTALLMGGGLFTAEGTLEENCRRFAEKVDLKKCSFLEKCDMIETASVRVSFFRRKGTDGNDK